MQIIFNKCQILSLNLYRLGRIFVSYLIGRRLKLTSMIQSKVNKIKTLAIAGFALLAFLMFVESAFAQGWELTLGDAKEDYGEAVIATSDWGALAVGYSESFGSDNDLDIYVVRTDVDGNILWTNIYDEAFEERAYSVVETTDGGFLIAGDISNSPNENANAYLLKISAEGTFEWSRQYGAAAKETFYDLAISPDGGYIMTGQTYDTVNDESDVLAVKVNAQGEEEWTRTYGGEISETGVAIAPYKSGYALTGFMDNVDNSVGKDILLYRLNLQGDTLWTKAIGGTLSEEAEDLAISQDDKIVIAGHANTDSLRAYIAKFDENGDKVWDLRVKKGEEDLFKSLVALPNGHVVAAGLSSIDAINVDLLIAEIDENGNLLWANTRGSKDLYESAEGLAATPDNGFLLAGYNGSIASFFNDLILIKTDGQGNSFANSISGRIYFDRDGLCDEDINDTPIEGWLVKVEGSDKVYFGTSDAEGNYRVKVDTGAYTVSLLLRNDLWGPCIGNNQEVQLQELYEDVKVDFPVSVLRECPSLEVNVSAPIPPVCKNADYFIDYRNEGTTAARNAYVEVNLDENYRVESSDVSHEVVGDKLIFRLGNLLPFEGGRIVLTVSSCEDENMVIENEAMAVKAAIYSDVVCSTAGPNWDGSSVEVSGQCAQDTVSFTIKNVGDEDMSEEKSYGVVEDLILFREGTFKLRAGESTRVFWQRADGPTYRIIAEQVQDHPGANFPTFAIEGCVSEGEPFNTGFVTMFPENDRESNISIDVQEAFDGSVSEVELKGYPKGYKDWFIAKNTDLTYKILFNNFGTDTINRVVIRDTLPSELDITKVIPGASSHPYKFEIYDEGILKITFSDIELLPDGSADNSSSSGFVNFKVSQKLDNPDGTIISNSAAIFLGYNSPVQTNEVIYEVGTFPDFLDTPVSVNVNQTFVPGVKIKVSPNPFNESAVFEIEDQRYNDLTFNLYDLQGKPIRRERHNSNKFEIYRNQLTAGLYLYTISSEGRIIITGKVLVQ